jgi:hypothetical protein
MSASLTVLTPVALTALGWWFHRSRQNDQFEEVVARQRLTSAICSRARLIDGANHIAVALTLQPQQICYANVDLGGSVDIDQIDEVDYGSDLLTGRIAHGAVLRLRSHGRVMEFVLDSAAAEEWSRHLPPHRMNEAGVVHAA